MDPTQVAREAARLASQANALADHAASLTGPALVGVPAVAAAGIPFIYLFAIFVMACFVGYYVVWNVTPALHSPLMSVTNAISSVIIVGALIAAGPLGLSFAKVAGFVAVTLAAVNIFGGFIVTQRMLQMFQRKK